jgi:hypothetical protein
VKRSVFAASPQGVSLLGSNFSTSPGSGIQGQGALSNGQLGGHGLSNDNSDGVAFDINDFPQLSGRQAGSGGLQGSAGACSLALGPHETRDEVGTGVEEVPARHCCGGPPV